MKSNNAFIEPVSTKSALMRFGGMPVGKKVVAVGLLLLLIAVSGTFWMRMRDRFIIWPGNLGTYYGAIRFTDTSELPVLLEIKNGTASDGSEARARIEGFLLGQMVGRVERAADDGRPLVFMLDEDSVTLRGQRNESGEIVGTAESGKGLRGQFRLIRRDSPRPLSNDQQQEARSWILLQAERSVWDAKIAKSASVKTGKLEEIERLKSFVNDKTRLRAGADQKYARVAEQLESARTNLNTRKEKADKLAASLALAQRVTPFGRLVTLARESNERELRWIESMLRVGDNVGPVGIEDEVKRGFEILEAKDRIDRERSRIIDLGGDPDA